MSAVLSLRAEVHVKHELCWVAPESDDQGWLMVRAERHHDGLLVKVPLRARLYCAASLRGRAWLMTPAGESWLEQPCAASVVGEAGDVATLLLRPEGPPMLVEEIPHVVPRT